MLTAVSPLFVNDDETPAMWIYGRSSPRVKLSNLQERNANATFGTSRWRSRRLHHLTIFNLDCGPSAPPFTWLGGKRNTNGTTVYSNGSGLSTSNRSRLQPRRPTCQTKPCTRTPHQIRSHPSRRSSVCRTNRRASDEQERRPAEGWKQPLLASLEMGSSSGPMLTEQPLYAQATRRAD
jgi:hypothetical protein